MIVRRPPSAKELTSIIEDMNARKPKEREYLSREEFAATQAALEDIQKVEELVHANNLDIVEVNATQRSAKLSGTASALSTAF